jgi:hypothetical protein
MGKIVNAMALSHAFAMRDPGTWDEGRRQNRSRYIERQGQEPPVPPGLAAADPADDAIRFEHIRSAQEKLRQELAQAKPDIAIVVGDDQNENLGKALMPQIAVYTGGDYIAKMRHSHTGRSYRAEQAFSLKLLEVGVKRGFDIASIGSFADNTLMSHAHVQALDTLFPENPPATVIVFVNAIHHPAPEPSRCFALGELLADVVRDLPDDARVAVCGSGGMSHFTASYPWKTYQGPFTYGGISEDFDRKLIAQLNAGDISRIAALSSEDLLQHGAVEFRAWIVVAGAMRGAKTSMSVYEPFYRALMGMGVAAWAPAAAAV